MALVVAEEEVDFVELSLAQLPIKTSKTIRLAPHLRIFFQHKNISNSLSFLSL
ncbi:hypothetical protein [Phascolarctobacterium faecium]|uniref:hypothetical protein n=1 Tax=Phascolarctobacterium faecium TaxID=33025 RepID=UPI003521F3BD